MTRLSLKRVGVRIRNPEGGERWILKDISANIHSKDRIGLLGKNGSGKTTLVRVIVGLEKRTHGRIQVIPPSARRMIVLQRPEDLFVRGTVGEQINSYAPLPMSPNTIHELMDSLGLPPALGLRSPLCLSFGQQRLLAILCALATRSDFIIMDEPMAGLDADARCQVRQALLNLKKKNDLGWLITSHHPDDLLGLVERVWVMENGNLLYDGLFQQVPQPVLEAYFSPHETSLYYRLRLLECQGTPLPETIYATTEPEQIVRLLLS